MGPHRDRAHRHRRDPQARQGRVGGPAAEQYSDLRALKAIARADVAVLVLDAADGLTAQDAHVAGYVIEEGRGLVIAVNKWDIVEDKTHKTFDELAAELRRELAFIDYAPIVSISAKTGQRVQKVLELAVDVWGERRRRIATGRAQPARVGRGRAHAAGGGPRAPLEDPVRDAGGRRAADVRVLRDRRRVDPLLVPALPREPAARGLRVRRDADPARVPGAGPREEAVEGPDRARPEGLMGVADGSASSKDVPARVAVVGAGAWGTTLAAHPRPARAGHAPLPLPGDGGTHPPTSAATRRGCRASTSRPTCVPPPIPPRWLPRRI